jgi:sugar phosphate isomerase/epimerase
MRVGVFTGYVDRPLAECAARIARLGLTCVQLDFKFPDIARTTAEITGNSCRTMRETLARTGLSIAAVSGYVNLMAPDPERRRANTERLKTILSHAPELGCPYVVTETGTRHPEDDWAAHPDNATPEAYEEFRDAIAAMAEHAARAGAEILIEGAVGNVIDSPAKLSRLFEEVPSPALGLLMDPTNYLDASNLARQPAILHALFAPEIEARIRVAHAKDVRRVGGPNGVRLEKHNHMGTPDPAAEWPGPGLGELDYDLYLELLARNHDDVAVIIEHLEEADIPRAKRFVEGRIRRATGARAKA